MSTFIDLAVNVFDVIREIIKSYLTDDAEATLYRTSELSEFFNQLTSQKIKSLKGNYLDGFMHYSRPLPLRPHYSKLYHARILLILEVKNLSKEVEAESRPAWVDGIFLDVLSKLLQNKSFNLSDMTPQQVDTLFDQLKPEFRHHFSRHLEYVLSDLSSEVGCASVEISDIFDIEGEEDDRDSQRITSTPFSFSRHEGRSSSVTTINLFSPIRPCSSMLPSTLEYDSDLDEYVEETIIEAYPGRMV